MRCAVQLAGEILADEFRRALLDLKPQLSDLIVDDGRVRAQHQNLAGDARYKSPCSPERRDDSRFFRRRSAAEGKSTWLNRCRYKGDAGIQRWVGAWGDR